MSFAEMFVKIAAQGWKGGEAETVPPPLSPPGPPSLPADGGAGDGPAVFPVWRAIDSGAERKAPALDILLEVVDILGRATGPEGPRWAAETRAAILSAEAGRQETLFNDGRPPGDGTGARPAPERVPVPLPAGFQNGTAAIHADAHTAEAAEAVGPGENAPALERDGTAEGPADLRGCTAETAEARRDPHGCTEATAGGDEQQSLPGEPETEATAEAPADPSACTADPAGEQTAAPLERDADYLSAGDGEGASLLDFLRSEWGGELPPENWSADPAEETPEPSPPIILKPRRPPPSDTDPLPDSWKEAIARIRKAGRLSEHPDLLPRDAFGTFCPFCGARAVTVTETRGTETFHCGSCGRSAGIVGLYGRLINVWDGDGPLRGRDLREALGGLGARFGISVNDGDLEPYPCRDAEESGDGPEGAPEGDPDARPAA